VFKLEKCNNIFPLNTECCFVETTSSSSCEEYYPDLINFDSYVEDKLKDRKTDLLTPYLLNNDIESLEINQIISELESRLIDIEKIYCNSVTKEISYSSIKYTEDDIEKAKQENFCGKLMLESEITEEQCINGIVFSDLAAVGEKCCYAEINIEEYDIKYSQCISLSLSEAQRGNEKYLKSLVEEIDMPIKAKITCNGYNFEKSFSPSSSEDNPNYGYGEKMKCQNINVPSKEKCNNINLLNSECCYETENYHPKVEESCQVYS